jgi:O-antigen ligase
MSTSVGSTSFSMQSMQTRLHSAGNFSLVIAFFGLPTSRFLLNIGLLGFLVCFLLSGNYRAKFQALLKHPISLPLLLLFFVVLLGCLHGPGTTQDRTDFLHYYVKLMIGLAVIAQLINNPRLQQFCIQAFVAAMLLTAAISLSKWLGWLSNESGVSFGADIGDLAAFKDYLIQSVMMGMLCVIALSRLFDDQSPPIARRLFWTMALGLGSFVLFVAVERGRTGQVGFLLGLLIIVVMAVPRSQRLTWICGIAVVVSTVYLTYSPWRTHINRAVIQAYNYQEQKESSVGNRLYLYQWAYEQSLQRPLSAYLIGTGTASYPVLARKTLPPQSCSISCPHPHSQFIMLWIEYGLLGLGSFCLLFVQLFKLGRSAHERAPKIMLMGFIGIFLIDSLFHSSLWLRMEGYFSIMMIALLTTSSIRSATSDATFETALTSKSSPHDP